MSIRTTSPTGNASLLLCLWAVSQGHPTRYADIATKWHLNPSRYGGFPVDPSLHSSLKQNAHQQKTYQLSTQTGKSHAIGAMVNASWNENVYVLSGLSMCVPPIFLTSSRNWTVGIRAENHYCSIFDPLRMLPQVTIIGSLRYQRPIHHQSVWVLLWRSIANLRKEHVRTRIRFTLLTQSLPPRG